MTARHANELLNELLYDSEAALRLVDSAIEDIGEPEPRTGRPADSVSASHLRDVMQSSGPLGLIALSQALTHGYGEIVSVLGSLRASRHLLERATMDRLRHTQEKLREVSKATETAATDILDGLDRSLALVDEMDAKASEADAAAGVELRHRLRDELFSLMSCMQGQDITAQQLNYASSVLTEMETRLAELASILDPTTLGASGSAGLVPASAATTGPVAFDPAATAEDAEARQAVADQIFDRARG